MQFEMARLEARYGRGVAVLVVVLMVALAAVPVPGVSLLPLGVAELIRATGGR